MNLLSQCTPPPHSIIDDNTDHFIVSYGDGNIFAKVYGEANADLVAHAYDAELFAAAVASGAAWMAIFSRATGGKSCLVCVGAKEFRLPLTDFGTPTLTPESRAALQRAIGVER